MSLAELNVIVLTRDLPEHHLRAGDVGGVVHVCVEGKAYEVESVTGSGHTLAVETLEPGDIRPLAEGEIHHIRSVTAA